MVRATIGPDGTGEASPRSGRLSAEDWARAGLRLLMTEGRHAVKISRLCADFGVTKGSFYWHFADFDALMAAIARLYFSRELDSARGLVAVEAMPVEERLETMAAMLVDSRAFEGEAAIREWARADDTVAAAVRDLDQRIRGVVHAAFVELGFSEAGPASGPACSSARGSGSSTAARPCPCRPSRRSTGSSPCSCGGTAETSIWAAAPGGPTLDQLPEQACRTTVPGRRDRVRRVGIRRTSETAWSGEP